MNYKIEIHDLHSKQMTVYNIFGHYRALSMIYNLKYELYKASTLYKTISDIMKQEHVNEIDAQNIQNKTIDNNFFHVIKQE